jgi:predicted nuclease of predicted toxin-antitoxin system
VRFLLNMNLSRELGRLLETRGHQWRHVRDFGLGRAEDFQILNAAKAGQEVILTHDLDYGQLLAFSGDVRPSVVIFRCRNILPTTLFGLMMKNWDEWGSALEEGALIIVEDAAARIRRLPIGRSH